MLPVHEMLSRTARDHPRREALVWRNTRMSYAELDAASTDVARFLRERGVARGERVALHTPKCPAEVAAIFGVFRAGCVLVDVNPAFREEQLQHVVAETEPAALFFHPAKRGAVERLSHAHPRLVLPLDADYRGEAALVPAAADAADDDVAAILYTSGTTAKAKGIVVTHRILSESTLVSAEVLANVPADRLISLTSFSFDGALSQLFTSVLVGGTLVLQDSQFPRDVVKTLLAERITGCHAVPSFWRMVLERHPSFAETRFPDLRYLTLVGEVFPPSELARLKRILSTTDFFMMYGTTEAFRSTCLHPRDFERKPGSVGKPLPGVDIAVVDERGERCAPGVAGEIVHRGAFVSPGYWRRGASATFRDGAVHTGDVGMLDDEGYLYFVGRKDTRIKRLGFQVYPEEIEACVAELRGVALAAVVADAGGDRDTRIRAFVVPERDVAVTREGVALHCRRHLPHYMQPDEISVVAALPMTGTCKIDRARLSAVQP